MTVPSLSVTSTESRAAVRSIDDVPTPTCTAMPRSRDHPAEQRAARLVQLLGHQARRHLDDVGLQAELAQRIGGLQAQQTAADHHAHGRMAGVERARSASARIASRSSSVRYTWHDGRSCPGTGGTNAYEPVASTSAS